MVNNSLWEDSLSSGSYDPSFDNDLSFTPEQLPTCNAEVTKECSGTCPSTPIIPIPNIPITVTTDVVVKIPVVLAETTITIPVISRIHLERRASEIKRIGKHVFVTQCHLIPGSVTTTAPFTGVLVISGFVRKNIEYATNLCIGNGISSGRILDTTADIPFTCTSTVTFIIPPVFTPNTPPTEFETLNNFISKCDICTEISSGNICERNFSQTEVFNERVFCELLRADIFETDITLNPSENCLNPTVLHFQDFEEKMVVNITLKLLQKQQVRVTAIAGTITGASGLGLIH